MPEKLQVRSNVRRDLLQSSQLFKNDRHVIWEYVANSLQYVDVGVVPEVNVQVDNKTREIMIADNGRGMSFSGLQNFFIMHGENQDRLSGQRGRGRFGTGKSAAFGIARSLTVSTVHNNKRNEVVLSRAAIDSAGDDEVPIEIIEQDVPTQAPNGTIIRIGDVQLKRIDIPGIVKYIERQITRWPGRPAVTVNGHLCEPHEPPISRSVLCQPDPETSAVIGSSPLMVKIAMAPLDVEMQGIAVYADGVWLAQTLAGLEGQPFANHLFGDIDVPALDDESSAIPAFDMSRSMQLNQENIVVRHLMRFIGRECDRVRRELVKEDKTRRLDEEAKRLEEEASSIAKFINDDFAEFSSRINKTRSRGGAGRDATDVHSGQGGDFLVPSLSGILGSPTEFTGAPQGGAGGSEGSSSDSGKVLKPNEKGSDFGSPTGNNRRSKTRGGFSVEFQHLGPAEPRAKYLAGERSIYVNLDHKQISVAKGNGGIDSVNFRRLSYEVAFTEYAIALASEFAAIDYVSDPSETIWEIRQALNRMATRAAILYAEA